MYVYTATGGSVFERLLVSTLAKSNLNVIVTKVRRKRRVFEDVSDLPCLDYVLTVLARKETTLAQEVVAVGSACLLTEQTGRRWAVKSSVGFVRGSGAQGPVRAANSFVQQVLHQAGR